MVQIYLEAICLPLNILIGKQGKKALFINFRRISKLKDIPQMKQMVVTIANLVTKIKKVKMSIISKIALKKPANLKAAMNQRY